MSARKQLRPAAKSLPQAMRKFLTPAVFRQVRQATKRRNQPRWDIHPLLLVLLLATWCAGDSLPEKFEIARGFYVVCCPKRKRPRMSFSGFEKALAKLPLPALRALSEALRSRLLAVFGQRMFYHGFIPLGCDGTRQQCPRTTELEQRLGTFGKDGSAPMIWNTSIVHPHHLLDRRCFIQQANRAFGDRYVERVGVEGQVVSIALLKFHREIPLLGL